MQIPHRLEDADHERTQTTMPEPNTNSPKSTWLTPQFVWQVATFLVVQVVAAVIAFQILSADVRSSREEQGRMRTDIQAVLGEIREIRQAIPNREALDERLRNMEEESERLSKVIDSVSDKAEARWDNLNTRLSRKGL